ncbi:hypothetical protein CTAYLR_001686 [Chrysophaeum taylorii]|uniref:Uncharacterized protein n=1 Tax=Chrysophaeum taylorii TaxID=2483200 RepID=A0AAD7U678_9STRA|nr:hypothetical protein CTAYLR_001686 [Chrysophaeum taylorii]
MTWLIALIASSVAFAPVGKSPPKGVLRGEQEPMDLSLEEMFEVFEAAEKEQGLFDEMEGSSAPLPSFDPLQLRKFGSDRTLRWYRAAELKHGRVAMAATVGWIANEIGICFPGQVASGVAFKDLGKGLDAWTALPDAGKLQIVGFVGILEWLGETAKPHPMNGGIPGVVPLPAGRLWDPLGTLDALSAETKATKRLAELNNGRLAMVAATAFLAADLVPGSIPGLPHNW